MRRLAPGLVVAAAGVLIALVVHELLDTVSPLVVAVVIGALAANLGLVPAACEPGLRFAAKRLLRVGIVLLGFRLALDEVWRLGGTSLAVVVVVVVVTFFGTQWLGARLGLDRPLSLLVATGFSICGASAIAAVEPTSDASEEDVAYAIALVTLCGSLAIVVLPLVGRWLGLEDDAFGAWVGASVHDVAQVVAASSTGGAESLQTAVIVKLTRVALLAPLVAYVGIGYRKRHRDAHPTAPHPPVLPLFVVGFLAAAGLRSTGVVPEGWLPGIKEAEQVLLAAALVGLGTGVRVDRLRRVGHRPLVLGLVSWLLIAVVSYVGVLVST